MFCSGRRPGLIRLFLVMRVFVVGNSGGLKEDHIDLRLGLFDVRLYLANGLDDLRIRQIIF
jgi:hypothetical protein